MARIRRNLVGSVLVTLPGSSDPIALTAGQKVPEGIEVGDHVLEPESGRDVGTQTPPPATADDSAKAAAKEAKKAAKEAKKAAATAQAAGAAGSTPAGQDLTPPPLNGAGSSAAAWREYALAAAKAKGLGIEIPEDANRGDIVDALKSAGVRTE